MANPPELDFSNYSTDELMDLFMSLDREKDPAFTSAVENALREKLDRFPPPRKKFDISEFMHLNRIAWVTGLLPAIGIAYTIFNIMKSPTETEPTSYYPKNLYIHLIIIMLLGYGVYKENFIARILLVVYILSMISIYIFT